ncbi:MAG: hypothetical protein ACTSW3_04545 [Promethearchaeota archaeon]
MREFMNCLIVNLSNGKFGDCHRAMNYVVYSSFSGLFPFTRDIVVTRASQELNLISKDEELK